MSSTPKPDENSDLLSPDKANFCWRTLHVISTLWCGVWLRLKGHQIENLPTKGGALVLLNHQSYLDPIVIGTILRRPISFVARDTLFKVPVISFFMRQCYVMPIRREAATSSTIREAVRRIKHGFLVGLFPEGTRTRDGVMGRFKPGFISILKRADVPIIPVGIAGTYAAMPRGAFFVRPKKVCIVFGEPVTPKEIQALYESGKTDQELVLYLREKVADCHEKAELLRTGKSLPVNQTPSIGNSASETTSD